MKTRTALLLGMLCLSAIPAWAAGKEGIRMKSYGEVMIENFAIGQTYNLTQLMNQPLEIAYQGENASFLILAVQKPGKSGLKPGFEAVPDPAWVSLGNTMAAIAANSSYKTDIVITIPKDKKYLGKKYQAQLVVQLSSPNASAMSVGMGVVGRLLFTIAEVENPLRLNQETVNLNYTFNPEIVLVNKVALGKKVKIVTDKKALVALKNLSDKRIECEFISLDPSKTVQNIDAGYSACPNPEFLHFGKETVTVDPGQEKAIDMWLEFPNNPEYKDRKYQFTIFAQAVGGGAGGRYLRMLVDTAK